MSTPIAGFGIATRVRHMTKRPDVNSTQAIS